jgi:hypothetical protein
VLEKLKTLQVLGAVKLTHFDCKPEGGGVYMAYAYIEVSLPQTQTVARLMSVTAMPAFGRQRGSGEFARNCVTWGTLQLSKLLMKDQWG